ncbi:MAG TPA: ricin-type beta-trefoil lectin domain protein [Trebonia sp.]|jgi:hypothetical protein|nr:ricin-type beta-trefoil lectin domain protein [Trebonia sp.]
MSKLKRALALSVTGLAIIGGAAVAGTTQANASAGNEMAVWNGAHNHCLDNDTTNAQNLQMWNCTGGAEQHWLEGFNTTTGLFTFRNANTGNCITSPPAGAGAAQVTLGSCDAADARQQWDVFAADNPTGGPGWYDVWESTTEPGYCLRAPSVANGTHLETWPCDSNVSYERFIQQ